MAASVHAAQLIPGLSWTNLKTTIASMLGQPKNIVDLLNELHESTLQNESEIIDEDIVKAAVKLATDDNLDKENSSIMLLKYSIKNHKGKVRVSHGSW